MRDIYKSLIKCWKRMPRLEQVLLVIAICLTVFRIILAMKIPLYLQAGAIYDDRLFVNYSSAILDGKWLGDFDNFSLAKGASFSVFLAINYLLSLPYSFTLVCLFIVASVIMCVALSRLIESKGFLYVLYIALLFTPVMLHVENVQKIYRGGLIIIFAMLIIAGVIGIYSRIEERNRKLLEWVILTVVSLVFFWFLKEDSIWILPFVGGGILLSIIHIIRMKMPSKQKMMKVGLVLLPLIGLFVGIIGYKTINLVAYGEFAVTDRQGTNFKEVISDLVHIEGEGRSDENWVTRDMLNKAYAVSPTLAQIRSAMDEQYVGWAKEDGEIEGDIIFWAIKDGVAKIGYYQDGKTVNEFYGQIHKELSRAFEEGTLDKNNDFYISPVAKGITAEEMPEFLALLDESKNNIISYNQNRVELMPSTGDRAGIAYMDKLTMSQYIDPDVDISIYKEEENAVMLANRITKIYKLAGPVLFYGSVLIFAGFTVGVIWLAIKKKLKRETRSIYLITLGMWVTCASLFFGVVFFCRFLSQGKVYDYASPMLPILLIAELIMVYVLILNIKYFVQMGRKTSVKKGDTKVQEGKLMRKKRSSKAR